MIKVPYNTILEKITAQKQLSKEEIEAKIKEKMSQLSGLISQEGAAHIIANELGVKLLEQTEGGKSKIKDIMAGMRSVTAVGKVTAVYETREFQRKDGQPGKVGSFVIADETASMRIVLWNDLADKLAELKQDMTVKITNAYTKENNNGVEIHLSSSSELQINPQGESIGEVAQKQEAVRKKIEELQQNDNNIELMGTIVQAFEPRFYEVCPQCNKRVKPKEGIYSCPTHGTVTPSYGYVANITIDDGTSSIRTVFFRSQLVNLLKIDHEKMLAIKDNPASFQPLKDDLLGKTIKIVGRVSKNDMFDRLEFVAQLVFPDPNPSEELKRLEQEAQIIE